MKEFHKLLGELRSVVGLEQGHNTMNGKNHVKITLNIPSNSYGEDLTKLYQFLENQNEFEWTVEVISDSAS